MFKCHGVSVCFLWVLISLWVEALPNNSLFGIYTRTDVAKEGQVSNMFNIIMFLFLIFQLNNHDEI